ncbi:MAG: shikimate dehydrogenase [Clostridia bacterium]|nr:shikimate dehydrogenase [Clostridia bacterium]
MKYGCIGEHLGHSFSGEIHSALSDYEYEICEVSRDALDAFMTARDFLAINVTIPYKELVIPHLHYIDPMAREIGAVNTVVNREGLLYGYNTDFYGMSALIAHAGISLNDKKVIILGTGGTSKTAVAVASHLGAKETIRVSRTEREDAISYERLYLEHTDADIIINTTPAGMFPKLDACPVDISRFKSLSGVIDAIYNPLRSRLILDARAHGISAEGGLYMLVAQAVRASEIFLDIEYPAGTTDRVYEKIYKSKENIVLVGMPASGKSTVGALIASELSRELVDTDTLIVEREGAKIPDIFATKGEKYFRDRECEVIADTASASSLVIATGGGAPLREENVTSLRQNGRIYFIDRSPNLLVPTSDRPLAKDRAAIEDRYRERYPIYSGICDKKIDADGTSREVAEKILEDFRK